MTTSPTTRKSATLFAAAVIAVAAFAPSASAMPGLSSAQSQSSSVQDLRSPDTRDAANGSSPTSPVSEAAVQDLRSPDARDAAVGYAPVLVAEPVVTGSSSEGFDWVSAAIGAAAIGGLILVLVAFTVVHGRRGVGRRHVLHT